MEDYYTYYVQMCGVSEELFFEADVSFVQQVAENYSAYSNWKTYVTERQRKHGK